MACCCTQKRFRQRIEGMDTQSAGHEDESRSTADCEAVWLQRARGGDRGAFRKLVQAHQKRVFSIALRLTGQRADAEELAQDAFMQLHASLQKIGTPAHLKHWLIRTVSHRAIDRLRSGGRQGHSLPFESVGAAAFEVAPDSCGDPLAAARLQHLLLQLEPAPRAIVLLHFQQDLSAADIACALEMPVNTVKSHLRRSIEWLRAQCAGGPHGS